MKKYLIIRYILLVYILIPLSTQVNAQSKQYKARITVDYQKIMGQSPELIIAGKFKGDNGYEPTKELPLNIYRQVNEDSLTFLGTIVTNMKGDAEFNLEDKHIEATDSIFKHKYVVKIEDNERFKNASKSVSLVDVYLQAEAIEKDSVHYISAKLTGSNGNPIEGAKLEVKVERLFAPLTIGKSSYKTDENGTILVVLEEPLPGVDGILTFEVMLDSRKYGIVKNIFDAPIGVPVVDISTFDKRTMWSPPSKTPLFLWIFPNIVILGIWLIIFLLISNLYKIYKT